MIRVKNWQSFMNFDKVSNSVGDERSRLCSHALYRAISRNGTPGQWTIEGSSNGTTYGMDGVDRMGGDTFVSANWRLESNQRTWVVYKSPDSIGPMYMLQSLYTGYSGGGVVIGVSDEPFVGGTLTALPTSPSALSNNITVQTPSSYNNINASFSVADDGSFVYLTSIQNTVGFNSVIIFSAYTDDYGGKRSAGVFSGGGSTVSATTLTNAWWTWGPGGLYTSTLETIVPSINSNRYDLLSRGDTDTRKGTAPMWPLTHYIDWPEGGERCIRGTIPDIYLASASTVGDLAPATAPYEFISLGTSRLWVPADGPHNFS